MKNNSVCPNIHFLLKDKDENNIFMELNCLSNGQLQRKNVQFSPASKAAQLIITQR